MTITTPTRPRTPARRSLCALVATLAAAIPALAQTGAGNNTGSPLDPQPNGPRQTDPDWHFLVGPTVHIEPNNTIESCIVEIRGNRIVNVTDMSIVRFAPPAGAQVHDLAGTHIYAGFIDAHLPVDAPRPDINSPGAHWNANVTPQRSALDAGGVPAGDAERLRKLGFTAAAIAPNGGIFAGKASLVSLAQAPADPALGRPPVYREDVYQTLSFSTRGTPNNRGEFSNYPNSQMGVIALMRQTLSDADWRDSLRTGGVDTAIAAELAKPSALDALSRDTFNHMPLVFRTADELEGLRAHKVAREFDRVPYILGTGTEFRRLDAIPVGPESHTGFQPHYILPLTFPETPEVDTIGKADSTDLRTLMTWEQAPTNVRRLDERGVEVALTASGLRKGEKFLHNLHDAIEIGGLDPERALAMLTTSPASMLGVSDHVGRLYAGQIANIVVTSGDLFDPQADAKILDVWIDGTRHVINTPPPPFDGEWTFRVGEFFQMQIVVDDKKVTTTQGEGDDAEESKARNVKLSDSTISFLVDDADGNGVYVVSGVLGPDGVIRGTGLSPDSQSFGWTATRNTNTTEPEAQANLPDLSAFAGVYELNACPVDCTNPWLMVDPEQGVRFLDKTCQSPIWSRGVQAESVQTEGATLTATFSVPAQIQADKEVPVTITIDTTNPREAEATVESDPALYVFCGRPDASGSGVVTMRTSRRSERYIVTPEEEERLADLPPTRLPGYPFGPYAVRDLPPQQTTIFHNATVWTSGPDGIIENGWVAIAGGRIIGLGAGTPDIETDDEPTSIDLQGRHLTPGLLDAHSHTGISRGVNESGQAVTAEVRIGDVTDPDSLNWYRQLAGGVTTVNSMHGSANPIGGQTQTNKVRWGAVHPDDMHMQGAKPGIKFALGENVKQSNWESDRTRYPQTRMGVETLIRDRFTAAQEYMADKELWAIIDDNRRFPEGYRNDATRGEYRRSVNEVLLNLDPKIAARVRRDLPRIDLELEALAEILAGERLIHCHSYRQDEILMLCRIAEDFGFTIGTFQHGLEVYKVAEAVRDNAIGASLFSDWWAYKVEVQDAIAQAGPLQTEAGVLTSYNSDSDELSRRMNVEAGKAYKYSNGRLSKADALKFVTINPAIQLGIGDRIGSIEVGKDADLAIWSGEPLSSFSMCEATWIDGREYFSLERDAALREQNAATRARIIQKILSEGAPKPKAKGEESDKPDDEDTPEDNTTDEDPPRSLRERIAAAARTQHYMNLYLRGINPADHQCGDCGATQLQFGDNQ